MKPKADLEETALACRLSVAKLARVRCHPVLRYAPHAEHIGFVAYAGAETFALHWAVALISIYLLVTGLAVMIAKGN